MKKLVLSLIGTMFLLTFATGAFAQKKEIKTVVYDVSVHCNSCKTKIERDVAFEKGVKEITASVEDKTVTVKYDSRKTDSDKIAGAIKKLGYEVKVKGEKSAPAACEHKHDCTHKECEGHDHNHEHEHEHEHNHNN